MDSVKSFLKLHIFDILALGIIAVSLVFSIRALEYPIIQYESNRDYLVAHHIKVYAESPQFGPWNGFSYNQIKNSPVYYYILAAILYIRDSLMFLGLFNVYAQLLVIGAIYLLGKYLFSPFVGLVAMSLYAFSSQNLSQSSAMWQPYFMAVFLYASYLLLLWAYHKKTAYPAIAGSAMFAFAGAIHNSVFALIPIFTFCVWLVLRPGKNIRNYFLAVGAFTLTLTVVYVPVLLYYLRLPPLVGSALTQNFSLGPQSILQHVISNFTKLWRMYYQYPSYNILALSLMGLLLVAVFTYVMRFKFEPRGKHLLIVIGFIVQMIVLVSLFDSDKIVNYYFIPVSGLVILVTAEILESFFSLHKAFRVAQVIVIFLLIKTISANFYFADSHDHSGRLQYTTNAITEVTKAIHDQAHQIQMQNHYPEPNFFTVQYFVSESEQAMLQANPAPLWAPLEKLFNKKFVEISDFEPDGNNFKVSNSNEYLFLVCNHYRHESTDDLCLNANNPQLAYYNIIGQLPAPEPFLVYYGSLKK